MKRYFSILAVINYFIHLCVEYGTVCGSYTSKVGNTAQTQHIKFYGKSTLILYDRHPEL